jgi:hypothetical protein
MAGVAKMIKGKASQRSGMTGRAMCSKKVAGILLYNKIPITLWVFDFFFDRGRQIVVYLTKS